jgi:hypothetical protein
VAALIGWSAEAERAAIRTGRLPATRVVGRWPVAPANLRRWQHTERTASRGEETIDRDGLYRIGEAAAALGVSRQAVHQAMDRGEMAPVETVVGRRVRGQT